MRLEQKITILSAITIFMSLIDINVVNVAYPFIARAFHVEMAKMAMVGIVFLMMLAISIPIFGKLNDILGVRKIMLSGYFIFVISGVLCAVSPNLEILIFARGIQGVGAGMLSISSTTSVISYIPDKRRGKSLGIMGMAGSLGLILGSPTGGFLTDLFGWQSIFWMIVPIAIVVFVYAFFILPSDRNISLKEILQQFNFAGAIFITGFTACFVFTMLKYIKMHSLCFSDYILLGMGMVFLVLFIYNELNSQEPLIGIGVLKDMRFSLLLISNMLIVAVLSIVNFIFPFFLKNHFLFAAYQIGIMLMIISAAYGITSALIGRFSDKKSPEFFCISGCILIFISNLYFLYTFEEIGVFKIVFVFICLGVGFGFFIVSVNKLILSKSTSGNAGCISAIFRATRQFGSLAGILVIGIISETISEPSLRFCNIIVYEMVFSLAAFCCLFLVVRKCYNRSP